MPTFTARILTETDRPAWQDLWTRSPRLLGLHWEWARHASVGAGLPQRIGIFDASGTLRAGIPFVARKNRWMLEWRHPAPASFTGLLHAEETLSESFLRDALGAAASAVPESVDLAEVVFQPGLHDVRGLLWSGWEAAAHYTCVTPLTSVEDFAGRAENAVRRQADKARQQGLQSSDGGIGILPDLLDLYERTRRRQSIPPYVTPDAWRALASWLAQATADGLGANLIMVRTPDGSLQAAGFFGRDPTRVYYLLGASDPDSLGSGAPTLLHFEAAAIVLQNDNPPSLYDWVGANTPSVAQFKKKFRPDLELLLRATRMRPRRKLLQDARFVFRRTR
jgi:hypothetical protein